MSKKKEEELVSFSDVKDHIEQLRAADKKRRFEYPDPRPMAPPVGFVKQESMFEQMRRMVRSEHLRVAALASGAETFEEADDFEVGDDYDPRSPYEMFFDPPVESPERQLARMELADREAARKAAEPVNGGGGDPPAGRPPRPSKKAPTPSEEDLEDRN